MKITLATSCLVLGALLGSMGSMAYAADDSSAMSQSKPMRAVKDSVITTKVKAKLMAEKMSYAKDIKVETDLNGIVSLGGTVATQEDSDKATDIAQDTDGVNSVRNHIKVQPAQ
ncbi:BON domain-containing protein [Glaciimonas sp. PCH181]|uniref:BON domain-containing protein n=1 Tax=Glaciimonas sp. PCH181 TaxID=2133943 RepID=UPI000D3901E0|nr:BON domain-containing protein [Glaciimonas sp. PCH181]PUA18861.1 transporter [Glaciimonas sp. PCH181]